MESAALSTTNIVRMSKFTITNAGAPGVLGAFFEIGLARMELLGLHAKLPYAPGREHVPELGQLIRCMLGAVLSQSVMQNAHVPLHAALGALDRTLSCASAVISTVAPSPVPSQQAQALFLRQSTIASSLDGIKQLHSRLASASDAEAVGRAACACLGTLHAILG